MLNTAAPEDKIALTHDAWWRFNVGGLPIGVGVPPDEPARPQRPQVTCFPCQVKAATSTGIPRDICAAHNLISGPVVRVTFVQSSQPVIPDVQRVPAREIPKPKDSGLPLNVCM